MEQMDLIDSFYPVCEDVAKLSLASYLCDLAKDAYETSDKGVLSLLLNTLYVISYKDVNISLIKAVFEIKLSQYMGYEPHMDSCIKCENDDKIVAFSLDGGVKCTSCVIGSDLKMSKGTYEAILHILNNTNIFSFSVSDEVKKELSHIAEGYILEKCERDYKSLDYLKKMM